MKNKVTKKEIEWEVPEFKEQNIVGNGDVRIVDLQVKVLFEWSDKIIDQYDYETNNIIEYTSGYIMKVLPNQEFIYKNENTIFIGCKSI